MNISDGPGELVENMTVEVLAFGAEGLENFTPFCAPQPNQTKPKSLCARSQKPPPPEIFRNPCTQLDLLSKPATNIRCQQTLQSPKALTSNP